MENNTTLSTSVAIRAAFSHLYAQLRKMFRIAVDVMKCIVAILYLFVAVCLVFSESEVFGSDLNFVGILMLGAMVLYLNNSKD